MIKTLKLDEEKIKEIADCKEDLKIGNYKNNIIHVDIHKDFIKDYTKDFIREQGYNLSNNDYDIKSYIAINQAIDQNPGRKRLFKLLDHMDILNKIFLFGFHNNNLYAKKIRDSLIDLGNKRQFIVGSLLCSYRSPFYLFKENDIKQTELIKEELNLVNRINSVSYEILNSLYQDLFKLKDKKLTFENLSWYGEDKNINFEESNLVKLFIDKDLTKFFENDDDPVDLAFLRLDKYARDMYENRD